MTFEAWTWALTFIAGAWLLCSGDLFPAATWMLDINMRFTEWVRPHYLSGNILLQQAMIKIHHINKSLGNQLSHICSTIVSLSSHYLWITVSHCLCFIFQIYVLVHQKLWQLCHTVKQRIYETSLWSACLFQNPDSLSLFTSKYMELSARGSEDCSASFVSLLVFSFNLKNKLQHQGSDKIKDIQSHSGISMANTHLQLYCRKDCPIKS